MIIKHLSLKNFLAHKDTQVDFATSGITAFIGDNGSGKSSIIEGISFALFGKSSKGNLTDLVYWGTKNAKVELIFEKNGVEFKIVREIKLTGKSASTTSAVYKKEKGTFSLYYQKNVNKEIPKLIGMNQKTFFSSVLVKQGDIEGLLNLKPKDRAKVFEDLLDMSIYQLLSEYYAEKRKELENQKKGLSISIEDHQELENNISSLQKELNEIKKQIKALNEEKTSIEEEELKLKEKIKNLIKEKEAYIKQKNEIEKLTERKQNIENQLRELEEKLSSIKSAKEKIPEYENAVNKLKELEELLLKSQEREKLKERLKFLKEKLKELQKYQKLKQELETTAKEFEKAQEKLKEFEETEKSISLLSGKLQENQEQQKQLKETLKSTKQNALKIAKQLTKIKPIFKTLELNPVLAPTMIRDGNTLIEKYQKELMEIREKGSEASANVKILTKQIKDISKLEGSCPTCHRPVEEHSKEELLKELKEKLKKYKEERERLIKQYRELEDKIETEKEIIKLLEDFYSWFEKHQEADKKLKELKAKEFSIKNQLEKLNQKLQGKKELEEFINKTREKYFKYKQAEEFLKENKEEKLKEELKNIESKLNQYQNVPSLEEIQKEIKKLKPLYDEFLKLMQVIKEEQQTQKNLQNLREQLSKTLQRISALQNTLPDVKKIEEKISQNEEIANSLNEKKKDVLNSISNLNLKKGEIEGKLKIYEKDYKQLQEKLSIIKDIEEKIEKYSKLEAALGAKGIQKVIRDNALYKLPQLVNLIFSRFGFGFSQVKFTENFDISVLVPTNETKERYLSIDSISGGQKVALSLALRLALGYFLSGKSEFLILDEPTIHLDQQRREELVSILINLKNSGFLKQLIVITHDKELEDVADQIYYVKEGKVINEV